jgi:hypothetical protein
MIAQYDRSSSADPGIRFERFSNLGKLRDFIVAARDGRMVVNRGSSRSENSDRDRRHCPGSEWQDHRQRSGIYYQ